jgi:hypothetical protein
LRVDFWAVASNASAKRASGVDPMKRVVAVFVLFALAGTASAQAPDLSGQWSGHWLSDTNGHTGPLYARFRQVNAETYRVAFHGRFAKVVPFWYTTKLHVDGTSADAVQLSARQQLPLLGSYQTSAVATASSFDASFSSRKDSGRFVLSRR